MCYRSCEWRLVPVLFGAAAAGQLLGGWIGVAVGAIQLGRRQQYAGLLEEGRAAGLLGD